MHNVQNEHIRTQLAKVNTAVGVLEHHHLTITAISIDGPWPLIEILEGRGCNKLNQVTAKWHNLNGRRRVERTALVGACQVRWLERD